MYRLSDRIQKLIFNLAYASLVFSLVYMLGLGMDLRLNIIMQILIVFIGSMVVKFFLLNPIVLFTLLTACVLGIILVHRFITPIAFLMADKAIYLFNNIINNLQGKENIASDNLLLLWGILIVFLSFFTAFILFKSKSIYWLLPVYIGLFLVYWYNYYDQAYLMISIFFIFFFVLMGLNKYCKERTKVKNSTSYSFEGSYVRWLKIAITYSILIVSIALLLPKSNSYIGWPWLYQAVYNAFPGIEDLRSNDISDRESSKASIFDFSFTDYHESSSKLGGPVSLSDKKIMTVYSDDNIYLRGSVKHTYTGDQWKTITGPLRNYKLKQDFSGLSEYEQETYYDEKYITITNRSFASTTIFSPYRAVEVYSEDYHILNVNRDNILFFSEGVHDRESYTVKALKPLPYGMLISLGINQKRTYMTSIEEYLQIPKDRITSRTKNLVKEIVKDSHNDFQKAQAIEGFLRNNYKYNLNVNQVPEGKEFIDYFLFEEQEGYCTYFATSMAIMLRLEGIPSRYVEGYLTQETDEPGIYEVRSKNAHAWVEAFIEPVGWMTFEPTPAYPVQPRLEDYQPVEDKVDDITINGIDLHDKTTDEIDLNNKSPVINFYNQIIDNGIDILYDENNPAYNEPAKNIPNEFELRKKIADSLLIVLLLMLPMRFLIGFSKYVYQEAQTKKLSNNDRVICLYGQIVKLIEFLGYPQKSGETHYEYAKRTVHRLYTYNVKGTFEITDIFVRSKYGGFPASDEDIMELKEYRKDLEKYLRNRNPIVYYYRKYMKKGHSVSKIK
ncbi:transglutaminase domain-containing protein [Proteiniborus sp. MB09-C3]|uniref:DUF4129 domain-containing transglutaminase family protein n=1 Tax=Proteiniborus sp. MB09-C3 TaxID=3050072 RepID=UPI0025522D4F|nr:transglutaminase domain-containing protein [Proteiniborus sp. MB09-C3]WIV13742.1 transglutaminase domain-containing protein [Proteiniborus sp. MB09-C3]